MPERFSAWTVDCSLTVNEPSTYGSQKDIKKLQATNLRIAVHNICWTISFSAQAFPHPSHLLSEKGQKGSAVTRWYQIICLWYIDQRAESCNKVHKQYEMKLPPFTLLSFYAKKKKSGILEAQTAAPPTPPPNNHNHRIIVKNSNYWSQPAYDTDLNSESRTASRVGKAGIAPLSVTVNAPHAFAKLRASVSRLSSYKINNHVSENLRDKFQIHMFKIDLKLERQILNAH